MHQAALAVLRWGWRRSRRPHSVLFLGVGALFLLGGGPFSPRTWLNSGWVRWLPLPAAVAPDRRSSWPLPGTPLRVRPACSVPRTTEWVSSSLPNACGLPDALGPGTAAGDPWSCFAAPVLRRWWLLLIATSIVYAMQFPSGRAVAPIATVAALGVAVLWDILVDAWVRRDPPNSCLGLWLFLPLAALPYAHLPAKPNLAAAPAAAILVA